VETNLAVDQASGLERFDAAPTISEYVQEVRGMAQAREINLIPADLIEQEHDRQRIRIWAELIVLTLVALSAVFIVGKRNVGNVERIIEDLTAKNQQLQEKITRLGVLQERRNSLVRKERTVKALLARRSMTTLFAELDTLIDRNLWLTSMKYVNRAWTQQTVSKGREKQESTNGYFIVMKDDSGKEGGNGHARYDISLRLEGLALSMDAVADFLQSMSGSDKIVWADLNSLERKPYGSTHLIEFEVASGL
jgi:Tfp pilus assembly protein PilN